MSQKMCLLLLQRLQVPLLGANSSSGDLTPLLASMSTFIHSPPHTHTYIIIFLKKLNVLHLYTSKQSNEALTTRKTQRQNQVYDREVQNPFLNSVSQATCSK